VISVLALHERYLPESVNLVQPDPEFDLCFIQCAGRKQSVNYAINNSFGFGGINCSLLVGRAS
jgi:beta-ketoacyl ACP synthase